MDLSRSLAEDNSASLCPRAVDDKAENLAPSLSAMRLPPAICPVTSTLLIANTLARDLGKFLKRLSESVANYICGKQILIENLQDDTVGGEFKAAPLPSPAIGAFYNALITLKAGH